MVQVRVSVLVMDPELGRGLALEWDQELGQVSAQGTVMATEPGQAPDWALVLDRALVLALGQVWAQVLVSEWDPRRLSLVLIHRHRRSGWQMQLHRVTFS